MVEKRIWNLSSVANLRKYIFLREKIHFQYKPEGVTFISAIHIYSTVFSMRKLFQDSFFKKNSCFHLFLFIIIIEQQIFLITKLMDKCLLLSGFWVKWVFYFHLLQPEKQFADKGRKQGGQREKTGRTKGENREDKGRKQGRQRVDTG